MPPNNQNRYDFILSSNQKPHRGFNFGNSLGARIALIVGGVIILIIVGLVINSILSSGDKAQTQRLTDIVQAQAEIIRVSGPGIEKSKNSDTLNNALNTQSSVQSSQLQVKSILKKHGVNDKAVAKTLGAAKNAKTDQALDEATKNNRFDETYQTVMLKQLVDYQKLLKSALASSTPSEKKPLNAAFENVGKLAPKTVTTPINS